MLTATLPASAPAKNKNPPPEGFGGILQGKYEFGGTQVAAGLSLGGFGQVRKIQHAPCAPKNTSRGKASEAFCAKGLWRGGTNPAHLQSKQRGSPTSKPPPQMLHKPLLLSQIQNVLSLRSAALTTEAPPEVTGPTVSTPEASPLSAWHRLDPPSPGSYPKERPLSGMWQHPQNPKRSRPSTLTTPWPQGRRGMLGAAGRAGGSRAEPGACTAPAPRIAHKLLH